MTVRPYVIPFAGRAVILRGGPYRERPEGTFGICMAKELIDLPHDVFVPTRDFHTPPPETFRKALYEGLEAALDGRQVYVGCMGGIGRTGLYLAVMAKALGVVDPVQDVRKLYYAHAVETRDQERFVRDFKTSAFAPYAHAILDWKAKTVARNRLRWWRRWFVPVPAKPTRPA
jgi:hypothetical protein